jgi:predicted RNA methylase
MSDIGLYYTPPWRDGDVRIVDIAEGTGGAMLSVVQEMQRRYDAACIVVSNPPFGATGKTLPAAELLRRLAEHRDEELRP